MTGAEVGAVGDTLGLNGALLGNMDVGTEEGENDGVNVEPSS